jgi:Tol biopolymer transport system component
MRTLILALTLTLASTSASAQSKPVDSAQGKRAATFDDVLSLKAVQGATVSPDGRTVIYTVREWVDEQDRKEARTRVWRVATDGSAPPRQITFGEKGETQPAFSPDGRYISFVAARGGADAKAQIYLMSIGGGEAWKLTDAKENVSAYSWAPDSRSIAYVATDPRSAAEEAAIKKRDDERVFEGDFRYAHAWVVDISTKQATRVTEGTQYTLQGAPSWAPDGRRFVFAAAATPMLRDNRRDVYIATLGAAGGSAGQQASIEKISTNWGNDSSPRWSPDGRTIAFVTEPNTTAPLPDGTASSVIMQGRLVLYDVAAKTLKDTVTPSFDTEAGNPIWTNEGTRVLFVSGKRAYNEAFAYDVTTGAYTQLTRNKTISSTAVSNDGKTIIVTMDAPDSATDIYATDPSFANFTRLTNTNPQLADLQQGETEVITWKSSDGVEVEGCCSNRLVFAPAPAIRRWWSRTAGRQAPS